MRWTNREVRKVLRLLRRPHMLERERLAVMLRECTQTRTGRDALQFAIESAFDKHDPSQRALQETIQRVDLHGETTHSAAAHMHLSVRQFFRYRSEAFAAIAQSIERILRRPSDSHRQLTLLANTIQTINPKAAREIYVRVPARYGGQVAYNVIRTSLWAGLEVSQEQIDACEGPWRLLALAAVARHLIARGKDEEACDLRAVVRAQLAGNSGALYDAVAFELATQDILDAHRHGDIERAGAITETVRALAGPDEQLLAYAMTIEAQQHILQGDVTAAALVLTDLEALDAHGRDHSVMARSAYCNAMLSHMRGFHDDAYALANGAGPAIAALEAGFGFRAATIAGRAALQAGIAWTPPHELIAQYPDLWTRAETEGVIARHELARDPASALRRAQAALTLAKRHNSAVISAYLEGAIAAARDLLGQTAEAQTLWLGVWERALQLRDEFALYDLFVIPAAPQHDVGPLRLDERFLAVLQRHIERVVPAFIFTQQNGLDAASTALLQAALLTAIGKPAQPAKLATQAQKLGRALTRLHIPADQTKRVGALAARAAAHALTRLLPAERRQHFQERFFAAWVAAIDQVQSAMFADVTRLRA